MWKLPNFIIDPGNEETNTSFRAKKSNRAKLGFLVQEENIQSVLQGIKEIHDTPEFREDAGQICEETLTDESTAPHLVHRHI